MRFIGGQESDAMNTELCLKDFGSFKWRELSDGIHVVGLLHLDEEMRLIAVAKSLLQGVEKEENVREALSSIAAFFALVAVSEEKVILIVDHIGSFPLYYAGTRGGLIVSTDPCDCMTSTAFDDVAFAQFIASYTTPPRSTLWMDVHEVEAGTVECVTLPLRSGEHESQIIHHYVYERTFLGETPEIEDIDEIAHRVFEDAISRFDDSPVLLPITSGVDSRTIATLLRECDLTNIYSFSIGLPDDADVVIGEQLAKHLGLPWQKIEVNKKDWEEYFDSDYYRRSVVYALRGGRLNHALMSLALQKMKKADAIPTNAIFVPGHAGAVMGGELKRNPIFEGTIPALEAAVDIARLEGRIGKVTTSAERLRDYLEKRIGREIPERCDFLDCSSIIDTVNMQDYIFKFIANDVRNYEFAGYRWYLPLMDKRWMDFWSAVPYPEVCTKGLIKQYLEGFSSLMGLEYGYGGHDVSRFHEVKTKIKQIPLLGKGARAIKRRFCNPSVRPLSPLLEALGEARFGDSRQRHMEAQEVMNAVLAEDTLRIIEDENLISFKREIYD